MPKKLHTNELLEAWENGHRIGEAWWLLSSEYEKEQIRNSKDERRTLVLENLMKMELTANVAAGNFVCLGISIPAPADGMPVQVPRTLFDDGAIDWDKDELGALGVHYGALRVIEVRGEIAPASVPKSKISAVQPLMQKLTTLLPTCCSNLILDGS